jgi:hypothetical protein
MFSNAKVLAIAVSALLAVSAAVAYTGCDHDHEHESDSASASVCLCHAVVSIAHSDPAAFSAPPAAEPAVAFEDILHGRQALSEIFRPPIVS